MEQPSKKIIAERNIWAQLSYRQQNEQVQWRRTKVQEIRSKGYSQREISQILHIDKPIICMKGQYLRLFSELAIYICNYSNIIDHSEWWHSGLREEDMAILNMRNLGLEWKSEEE